MADRELGLESIAFSAGVSTAGSEWFGTGAWLARALVRSLDLGHRFNGRDDDVQYSDWAAPETFSSVLFAKPAGLSGSRKFPNSLSPVAYLTSPVYVMMGSGNPQGGTCLVF